jgi:hypothetical protein
VNAPKNGYGLDSSLGIIFLTSFMKIGQMVRQLEWEVTGTYVKKGSIEPVMFPFLRRKLG